MDTSGKKAPASPERIQEEIADIMCVKFAKLYGALNIDGTVSWSRDDSPLTHPELQEQVAALATTGHQLMRACQSVLRDRRKVSE